MNNFDIKFETNYSDDENFKKSTFSLTFLLREHSLSLGQYVVYPSITNRELIFIPKYKYDKFEERFNELTEKIYLVDESDYREVRSRKREYFVSDEEILETKKLRGIISNSCVFSITGNMTSVSLPYKFIDMLQIKEDYMTFFQTSSEEFIIINPADAWMYSINSNFNYDDGSSSRTIFTKIKRAI